MRLHYPTVPERKGGMSLITIAILVLLLLGAVHAGSLKDATKQKFEQSEKLTGMQAGACAR
jgi:hypothetical protein